MRSSSRILANSTRKLALTPYQQIHAKHDDKINIKTTRRQLGRLTDSLGKCIFALEDAMQRSSEDSELNTFADQHIWRLRYCFYELCGDWMRKDMLPQYVKRNYPYLEDWDPKEKEQAAEREVKMLESLFAVLESNKKAAEESNCLLPAASV